MKPLHLLLLLLPSLASAQGSLKEAYRGVWRMGVSVNQWEVTPSAASPSAPPDGQTYTPSPQSDQTADFPLIEQHFDWLVPENCMKHEVIHPQPGVYDFTLADQLVDLARSRGLHVVGHCLVWHSQCAPWLFRNADGTTVSPDELKKRMREHIHTLLGHFRGRVEAWDVVNEAFNDDGTLRQSPFWQILGPEFIPLAFQYAHEADPAAELYYNDYSLNQPRKIDAVVSFFRPLVEAGLPLTAIGMQGHLILGEEDYLAQYDHSISAIASLGVKAQFTELDLSVLPNPYGFSGANVADRFAYRPELDPYPHGLPPRVQQQADQFWRGFFSLCLRHRDDILRLGFWDLNDANSWRNNFPVRGRTDHATLFDRHNHPKPTVAQLIELAADILTPSAAEGKQEKTRKNKKK